MRDRRGRRPGRRLCCGLADATCGGRLRRSAHYSGRARAFQCRALPPDGPESGRLRTTVDVATGGVPIDYYLERAPVPGVRAMPEPRTRFWRRASRPAKRSSTTWEIE